jgi:hypothetical protein
VQLNQRARLAEMRGSPPSRSKSPASQARKE